MKLLTGADGVRLPEPLAGMRVAFLGIGNELNGDDGAGVYAARLLKQVLADSPHAADHWLVLEVGPSPESFSGPLRRFHPGLVVMLDAANLDQPPGTLAWIDWSEAAAVGGSTHTLSPSLFARFLVAELGCRVALVGIQPAHLDFDRPLSAPVQSAVDALVEALRRESAGIS